MQRRGRNGGSTAAVALLLALATGCGTEETPGGDVAGELQRAARSLARAGWTVDPGTVDMVELEEPTRSAARARAMRPGEHARVVLRLLGHTAPDRTAPLGWYEARDHRIVIGAEDPGPLASRREVLAHELVHAARARWIAERLGRSTGSIGAPTWEDAWMLSLLMEGEATLATRLARTGGVSPAERLPDPGSVDLVWRSGLLDAWPAGLVGPGTRFVQPRVRAGGRAAVDELFAAVFPGPVVRPGDEPEPPLTSERILHPDTHADDAPAGVPPPARPPALLREDAVHVDRIGEFGLLVLGLALPLARRADLFRAALGWDGDRFWLWETGEERYAALWRSVWDREEDARQFVETFHPLVGGSMRREGRVVTWSTASDPALARAMEQALAEERVHVPARDPVGAAATAEAERRLLPAIRRATRLRDGRWELPLHGVALPLPSAARLVDEQGGVVAVLDGEPGEATVRIACVPSAVSAGADDAERGLRVAGRDARLERADTPSSGPVLLLHVDAPGGPLTLRATLAPDASPARIAAARRALTALEPLER